ncbi:MAG: sigma-70 family RNA polymerase sigma factor [Armatimonadota bacterium]|nr:sigma-70 family RNA polymerase sigma factor [Armatimonadota bacterium]
MLLVAFSEESGLAFEEIIDTYEKRVFNLIYRLVGDYDEAADLTQDTFVAAYRGYSRFRSECSVYTWLCRIAINNCKNRFRERDRRRQYEDAPFNGDDNLPAATASDESAPHMAVERKELRERIEQAIAALPEDYKIVVVLRDMHAMSYQEIAEATELSIDNVKVRLSRARAMLRRKLEPYLANPAP